MLFCIIAWIGFTYQDLQDLKTDQIVFLKVKNKNTYWVSKILFMFSVGSIMSLFGVIFPILYGSLRSKDLFFKDLTMNKVILGFCILILAAFMGAMLGMIFQKRVVGDRNRGILLLVLIVIMSIIKILLMNEFTFTKFITWILPPINNLTGSCTNIENFSLGILIISILYSLFYILIEVVIYIKLMKKTLF